MHGWAIFYGVLTFSVLIAAAKSKKEDVLAAAIILLADWIISNFSQVSSFSPYNTLYPITDAISAILVVFIWYQKREVWKLALVGFLLIDQTLHTLWFNSHFYNYLTNYRYDLALNIFYIGQLACVGWASLFSVSKYE